MYFLFSSINVILSNVKTLKTDSPSLMEDELGNLDTPIEGIFDGGRKPDVFISLFSEFSFIFD